MSKRLVALFGVAVIVVAACGAAATPTPPAGETSSPTAAPPTSDNFAFQIDSEVSTFSGAPDDLPTSWIAAFIYSTLYQPNNQVAYVPLAADGLPTTSADGLTWDVKIKPNIKFHDGSAMTADDVKFSFDMLKSKNCGQNPDLCSSIQDNVDTVTVKDPLTVEIKLKQKYAPFLATGLGSTLLLPKKAIEASFAKFQQAAAAVTADEVSAEAKKVSDAIATEDADGKPTACAGKTPPTSCDITQYTTEMEALLTKAGVTLPDKNKFNTGGDSGKEFVPADYATALLTDLNALATTLKSTAIDQIAAAFKILDFASHPIGSGPYMFVSYAPGEHVEMAAFPDYFGGGDGKIDPKKMPPKNFAVLIRDTVAGSTALGNDEIQWQPKIESDAYKTLETNPNVKIAKYADNGYYYLAFNLRTGHLYADKNLRTAFTMCIKHDEDVAAATDGNGIPVYANTPPFSWAFNPNVPKYTYDVAGAKKLIESAGWTMGSDGVYAKGGQRLSSTLYVRVKRPQRLSFATLAKDQLKDCGIEVNIVEADLTTVLVPNVLDYPNKFDTYLGGWSTSLDPDDYSIFHSSQITTADNIEANNFPGWVNADADKLLEQGRQELDQSKRKDIYAQFQLLIHSEAPYYFLWADTARTGFSARVKSQEGDIALDTVGVNYFNIDAWYVTPK